MTMMLLPRDLAVGDTWHMQPEFDLHIRWIANPKGRTVLVQTDEFPKTIMHQHAGDLMNVDRDHGQPVGEDGRCVDCTPAGDQS